MYRRYLLAQIVSCSALCLSLVGASGFAQESAAPDSNAAAFEALAEGFQKLFNEQNATGLAAQFLPDGELIDDEGNLYRGRDELQDLFQRFFATFPGATLELEVDSLRVIGSRLAIEEGTRVISAASGPVAPGANASTTDSIETNASTSTPSSEVTTTSATSSPATTSASSAEGVAAYTKPVEARVRYVCVWTKPEDKWMVASVREFADDPPPTPHELLQPLAWLVGDWVSEGGDSIVHISYRWSDDGNYLLGDYQVIAGGETVMDSVQRIGWDPLRGQIRSWLFDSDGGYGDGEWTTLEDGYRIRSTAVAPDGSIGAANIEATKVSDTRFVMKGTDRIVADVPVEDFEIAVTKQPPKPQGPK
jgi:uncharacterized protein (TIGR02246 family)